jgi:hypothetical protein
MLPTTITFDSSAKISIGSMVKTFAGKLKEAQSPTSFSCYFLI